MELDDFKTAWQSLDQRLSEQNALSFALYKDTKINKAKATLRPLIIGQVVQLIAGILMSWLFAPFWIEHMQSTHLMLSGMALHAYGIMFIVLAARELYTINQIDYAAPVLEIQKQLAALRTWRIRIAPIFAVTGSVIWIPLLLVIFAWLGADIWVTEPAVVYWFFASAAISFAIVFGIIFWLRHPSRKSLAASLDESSSGQSIRRALQIMDELERFAR